MEKNTLLAVVLSIVVLFGFYIIQGILFPPVPPQPVVPGDFPPQVAPPVGQVIPADQPPPAVFEIAPVVPELPAILDEAVAGTDPGIEQRVHINTDLVGGAYQCWGQHRLV